MKLLITQNIIDRIVIPDNQPRQRMIAIRFNNILDDLIIDDKARENFYKMTFNNRIKFMVGYLEKDKIITIEEIEKDLINMKFEKNTEEIE